MQAPYSGPSSSLCLGMNDHGNGDLNEGGKIDLAAHAHRAGLKRSAGSVGSGLKRGWEIKGERSVGGRTIRPSQRALITDCPLVSRIRKIGSPQFNSEAIGRLLLHLFRRRGRKDGRRDGPTDGRTSDERVSERKSKRRGGRGKGMKSFRHRPTSKLEDAISPKFLPRESGTGRAKVACGQF